MDYAKLTKAQLIDELTKRDERIAQRTQPKPSSPRARMIAKAKQLARSGHKVRTVGTDILILRDGEWQEYKPA